MAKQNTPELPFIAYKGDDPFAFVSYSHADADEVYSELHWLAELGVNVWYDEGISPGHSWPRELANTLDRCDLFVIFMTDNVTASEHCLREVHFAMQHRKPVLAIYLDDIELPSDWEFAIGDRQGILKHRLTQPMYEQKVQTALAEYLPIGVPEDAKPVTVSELPQTVPTDTQATKQQHYRYMIPLVMVAVIAAGIWWYQDSMRTEEERAFVEQSLAELDSMIVNDEIGKAYQIAESIVERSGPGHVQDETWAQVSVTVGVSSNPEGATMSYRLYDEPDGEWLPVGETPMPAVRLPRTMLMLKFDKPGFRTTYRAAYNPGIFTRNAAYEAAMLDGLDLPDIPLVELMPEGEVPASMVAVQRSHFPLQFQGFPIMEPVEIPGFLIDRLETTNAEYQEFVNDGGYTNPEYWESVIFTDKELTLDWSTAVSRFVDTTGRAGPANWELGKFPTGMGQMPVHGISWYEAMAYARYRGRSLPTIHHWVRAAVMLFECCEPIAPKLTELSNFGGSLIEAGTSQGFGPYGTLDMAGNVAEWIYNSSDDMRLVLGASAADPNYVFYSKNKLSPWDRSTMTGMRTVTLPDETPAAFFEPVVVDEVAEIPEPVSKEVLDATMNILNYVPFPRRTRVESEEALEYGEARMRTISFRSGNGDERVNAYIIMPNDMAPPYQPVVYMSGYGGFAGSGGQKLPLIRWNVEEAMLPLLRTGRAVVWPDWYGSFHRYDGLEQIDEDERLPAWYARFVNWKRELDSVSEYLEASEDFSAEEMTWMGLSFGASAPMYILPGSDQIKAALLISGGAPLVSGVSVALFQTLDIPVLMLNAQYDYLVPITQSERFYNAIGTPEAHKRRVVYNTGHWPLPRHQYAREVIDWLDKYVGAVE